MFQLDLSEIRSILLLGAHADDIEIGCGGTLLRLRDACPELQVGWVVFSGDAVRRAEAVRGAEAFLGPDARRTLVLEQFEDSCFPAQWRRIKQCFLRLREQFRPQLIFTHRRDDAHQDHRVVSELTWCTFRDHWVLEYEIPKYEGDLGQPNVFVSLTAEQASAKAEAIHATFASQHDRNWFTPETFRSLARIRGIEAGAEAGYAEAFHGRKIVF